MKSLFLDLYRGETIKEIDLQGLDHVISITATQEGRVFFKVFNIILKKSGSRLPRVELEEMGPSFEMIIRRIKVAAPEVMREALKIPRTLKVFIFIFIFIYLLIYCSKNKKNKKTKKQKKNN